MSAAEGYGSVQGGLLKNKAFLNSSVMIIFSVASTCKSSIILAYDTDL